MLLQDLSGVCLLSSRPPDYVITDTVCRMPVITDTFWRRATDSASCRPRESVITDTIRLRPPESVITRS